MTWKTTSKKSTVFYWPKFITFPRLNDYDDMLARMLLLMLMMMMLMAIANVDVDDAIDDDDAVVMRFRNNFFVVVVANGTKHDTQTEKNSKLEKRVFHLK